MVRRRLIALVLIKDGMGVQSIGFKKYLPIGRLDIVLEYLETWDVDEVILLDINASRIGKLIDLEVINNASNGVFLPISVGGGVSNIKDVELILRNGADKVVINTAFYNDKNLIKDVVYNFGSQSVILASDVKLTNDGYFAYSNSGTKLELKISDWIRNALDLDVAEIFINSIDKDGAKSGYDIELMKIVSEVSSIPVIAAGGAGVPIHISQLFSQLNVAAAVGNILHHREHSTSVIKGYLNSIGLNVRPSCFIDYSECQFNNSGELLFSPVENNSIF